MVAGGDGRLDGKGGGAGNDEPGQGSNQQLFVRSCREGGGNLKVA